VYERHTDITPYRRPVNSVVSPDAAINGGNETRQCDPANVKDASHIPRWIGGNGVSYNVPLSQIGKEMMRTFQMPVERDRNQNGDDEVHRHECCLRYMPLRHRGYAARCVGGKRNDDVRDDIAVLVFNLGLQVLPLCPY
jgi:hypothetical protein